MSQNPTTDDAWRTDMQERARDARCGLCGRVKNWAGHAPGCPADPRAGEDNDVR